MNIRIQDLLWLFLALPMQLYTQEPYLKHYTVDDGLPSNEIYHIAQDKRNNLVLATDRGAVLFDGYGFETLPIEGTGISGPVYYMYKTEGGQLLLSGAQGKIYALETQHLKAYDHNDTLASLYQHSNILIANSMAQKNDTLWISYNNDFKYNLRIGSCYVTADGAVRKWTQRDGLYFDLRKKFHYRQLNRENSGGLQKVFIRWPDSSLDSTQVELSWRGEYIRRLYHQQLNGYDIFCIGRKVLIYKDKVKKGEHLFTADVLHLTSTRAGELMVGFENQGAALFPFVEGRILNATKTFLTDYSVTFIYQDHQGGTWFSTLESGLFYRYPSAATYWSGPEIVKSMAASKGSVYVGYSSGHIEVFRNGVRTASFQLPLQAEDRFGGLAYAADSSLLFRTTRGFYQQQQGGFRLHQANDVLLLAAAPSLVFGTSAYDPQLNVYHKIGGPVMSKIPVSKRTITLHYDRNQVLWLGTLEGLYIWKENKLWNLSLQNKVFADRIVAIREMQDGALVIASLGNGIAVVTNDSIRLLDAAEGRRPTFINAMEVEGGEIWLSTNRGLTSIVGRTGVRRHFGLESGLPTLDIQDFALAGDWLYLKWLNRTATLSLASLKAVRPAGPVSLNALHVDGKALKPASGLTLARKQNNVEFQFSSVLLAGAQNQQYQYRLWGYDTKWQQTGERFVSYTNLPPGKYRFEVRTGETSPLKPQPPVRYSFVIQSAFWQQWWFLPLVLLTILLLFAQLSRLRIQAAKRKNQLLLDLAESRQKALLQLMNPHFAFNVLNSIQSIILKQDKLLSATMLSQFAKLMRLSVEMGQQKLVSLEKEADFLRQYLAMELFRSPGKFEWTITPHAALDISAIFIPTMLIQPFVENSIKHGFMHSDRTGRLSIRFFQDGQDTLYCAIEDNGIGRTLSAHTNRRANMGHRSSGIDMTLHRLKLLHQQAGTPYFYEVEDKTTADGAVAGTKTILSLPFHYVPS